MNLEDLRAVQVDERGTDSLQPLRPTFYADAADYLTDLRERRDRLASRVDDPFDSPEVRRLTDELETAEEVVEAIYERRVGKLVKRASLAAAGVQTDEAGLTEEEQALFSDLVDRIETHRASVLDGLDPGADTRGAAAVEPEERDGASPTAPPTDPGGAEATAARSAGEPEAEPADGSPPDPEPDGGATGAAPGEDDADRVTVRITADVGEIYGVDDRVYTLGNEDVVTLPSANAEPLLERGAAQRVE